MTLFSQKIERIKNVKNFTFRKDFGYGAFSFFMLAICLGIGIAWQSLIMTEVVIEPIIQLSVSFLLSAIIIAAFPLWASIILLTLVIWLFIFGYFAYPLIPLGIAGSLGLFLSASIQLVLHWDKVVILRMGKFRNVFGPGLHFLIPIIDRVAEFIDTRIRATDFCAEKTLTRDTVPVHVDALAFWMIWDAKHAVLEVENYLEAVTLSAQTALRDAIGKHELASLLSERESLGKEIQIALDTKTNPWGVSILSIEITDIIIPKELEDVLSKQAQAEREKQSRVILATAEVEIAQQFEEASKKYSKDPTALQLRAMNMVYEGIRRNNSMMLMPASILDNMNLGAVLGSAAMKKILENEEESGITKESEA